MTIFCAISELPCVFATIYETLSNLWSFTVISKNGGEGSIPPNQIDTVTTVIDYRCKHCIRIFSTLLIWWSWMMLKKESKALIFFDLIILMTSQFHLSLWNYLLTLFERLWCHCIINSMLIKAESDIYISLLLYFFMMCSSFLILVCSVISLWILSKLCLFLWDRMNSSWKQTSEIDIIYLAIMTAKIIMQYHRNSKKNWKK